MKAKRRRVPVTTKAARATQDRLTMQKIDPAFEPLYLAAADRMYRLRERREHGGRFGAAR